MRGSSGLPLMLFIYLSLQINSALFAVICAGGKRVHSRTLRKTTDATTEFREFAHLWDGSRLARKVWLGVITSLNSAAA